VRRPGGRPTRRSVETADAAEIPREPDGEIGGKAAKNIVSILHLEQEDRAELSPLHRISHGVGRFVGTVYFILLQCAGVLIWVLLNTGSFHLEKPFDPYPFSLLSVVLSMEAVLLTSFVLIRQSAIDLQSERRNHLDLQINMLAEDKVTTVLDLLRGVASKLDVNLKDHRQSEEQAKETPVESIAKNLRSREK
jgi:uncharacterized membrane protein